MKPSISHTQTNTSITIQTLRENAGEMLRVANHLEATQKLVDGIVGVGSGPRLVRRTMSAAARKKIAKAAKARWANKTPVVTGKSTATKTAA